MNRPFYYAIILAAIVFNFLSLAWMLFFLQFPSAHGGGASHAFFNAILLFLWAMLHSLLARSHVKDFITDYLGHHLFRVVYVITAGASLMVVLYFWRPVYGSLWQTHGISYGILSILYLCCIVGMFYSMLCIDYFDYLGIRSVLCHLKAQPEKKQFFEVKGPYAYCRHPAYLFLLMAFWIGPVMTASRFEFALIGSLYLIVGTFLEERNLREELGEVYDLYRANVPMWIPRRTPWHYKA